MQEFHWGRLSWGTFTSPEPGFGKAILKRSSGTESLLNKESTKRRITWEVCILQAVVGCREVAKKLQPGFAKPPSRDWRLRRRTWECYTGSVKALPGTTPRLCGGIAKLLPKDTAALTLNSESCICAGKAFLRIMSQPSLSFRRAPITAIPPRNLVWVTCTSRGSALNETMRRALDGPARRQKEELQPPSKTSAICTRVRWAPFVTTTKLSIGTLRQRLRVYLSRRTRLVISLKLAGEFQGTKFKRP